MGWIVLNKKENKRKMNKNVKLDVIIVCIAMLSIIMILFVNLWIGMLLLIFSFVFSLFKEEICNIIRFYKDRNVRDNKNSI